MARTPEGKVKDAVTKLLREFDVYYFFPMTHGFGRSGIPDIIACVNGTFVGIECKAKGKKPTALQHNELKAIEKAGGTTFIVDSYDSSYDSSLGQLRIALAHLLFGEK